VLLNHALLSLHVLGGLSLLLFFLTEFLLDVSVKLFVYDAS